MMKKRKRANGKGQSRHKPKWTNDRQPERKRKYSTKFFSCLIWLWNLRKEIVANLDKLSPATVHVHCTLFGDCKWLIRMNNMKNWVSNQRITFEMKPFGFFLFYFFLFSCVQFFLWIHCIWNRKRLRFLQNKIHLERIMSMRTKSM